MLRILYFSLIIYYIIKDDSFIKNQWLLKELNNILNFFLRGQLHNWITWSWLVRNLNSRQFLADKDVHDWGVEVMASVMAIQQKTYGHGTGDQGQAQKWARLKSRAETTRKLKNSMNRGFQWPVIHCHFKHYFFSINKAYILIREKRKAEYYLWDRDMIACG